MRNGSAPRRYYCAHRAKKQDNTTLPTPAEGRFGQALIAGHTRRVHPDRVRHAAGDGDRASSAAGPDSSAASPTGRSGCGSAATPPPALAGDPRRRVAVPAARRRARSLRRVAVDLSRAGTPDGRQRSHPLRGRSLAEALLQYLASAPRGWQLALPLLGERPDPERAPGRPRVVAQSLKLGAPSRRRSRAHRLDARSSS